MLMGKFEKELGMPSGSAELALGFSEGAPLGGHAQKLPAVSETRKSIFVMREFGEGCLPDIDGDDDEGCLE